MVGSFRLHGQSTSERCAIPDSDSKAGTYNFCMQSVSVLRQIWPAASAS